MCIQRPFPKTDEEYWDAIDMCKHAVVIPEGKFRWDVCEDCAEHLAAEQAEGSVGK